MKSPPANLRSLAAIADRLQLAREAIGLNQAELCRRTGIPANTYNQWEQGKSRPALDYAINLADATGVTLDYVYLGSMGAIPSDLADKIADARRARMARLTAGRRRVSGP